MRQATRGERVGMALCAAVAVAWLAQQAAGDVPAGSVVFAPTWLALAAATVGAVSLLPVAPDRPRRAQAVLRWPALLLLVWAANGLPFDALTAAGLIGRRTETGEVVMATVWWPGLVTRALAVAAAVAVGHVAFVKPSSPPSRRLLAAFGIAAFVLALPYPVLRLHWALGGSVGIERSGAAGVGFEPLIIAIPWVAAAILSLVLATDRPRHRRGPVVAAGWIGTVIVAMVGPAALWSVLRAVADGTASTQDGIELWVYALFYGSWFLWAIAGGAATRAYQLRSAP